MKLKTYAAKERARRVVLAIGQGTADFRGNATCDCEPLADGRSAVQAEGGSGQALV